MLKFSMKGLLKTKVLKKFGLLNTFPNPSHKQNR